jgi:hypothetical protein
MSASGGNWALEIVGIDVLLLATKEILFEANELSTLVFIAFAIGIGINETFMVAASVIAITTTPNVKLCVSRRESIVHKT